MTPLEIKFAFFGRTIPDLEQTANDQEAIVNSPNTLATSLLKRCKDLEGRSRLNNILFLGIPATSEGTRRLNLWPIFSETYSPLMQSYLWIGLIVQMRNEVLRRAYESSPLLYKGKRVFIFSDYTAAVAKTHTAFVRVKKELLSCPGVKFGLLFLSTRTDNIPK